MIYALAHGFDAFGKGFGLFEKFGNVFEGVINFKYLVVISSAKVTMATAKQIIFHGI